MRTLPTALTLVLALGLSACVVDSGDADHALQPDVVSPVDSAVAEAAMDATVVDDDASQPAPDVARDAVDGAVADVPVADVPVADVAPDAAPPAVRFVGRVDYSDPAGPRFAWSGSAIEARFSGTGVTLHLNDPGNYFRVAIDGVERTTLIAHAGTTSYTLATGLADGTHTLEVWRRTEAWVGATQFLGLTFPAHGALLSPPPAPTRRIEVIGDSVTCAYGVEGTGPCPFTLGTENSYEGYGSIAARALGAEVHLIAWSGKGMYRDWNNAMTAGSTNTDTLPDVYDSTLANESHSWDFTRWTPDVVVINLGNNDYGMGDPGTAFTDAYVAFVRRLRTHYPHAHIVATQGPQSTAAGRINAALTTLRAAGDTNVEFFQLTPSSGSYAGCVNHPNLAAQALMGAQLAGVVRTAMHW